MSKGEMRSHDDQPPIPPIQLNTWRAVVKIVILVMVWYITRNANNALTAFVDYSKLAADAGPTSTLCGFTLMGAKIGLLQGLIMTIQTLVVLWTSPTLFTALGPVLSVAFSVPIKLIAELRRAISSKPKDNF